MIPTRHPLSLYLHFPWCVSKCPYCDFNSHTLTENSLEATYIDALRQDLLLNFKQSSDRPIQSIFFGGGTPSLCSAKGMADIMRAVRQQFTLTPDCEVTLEANPNSADAEKFSQFYDAGINRLSIGIQSFNPKHLTQLGRAHSREEAFNAVSMAQRVGFESINLDLMYALPEQTMDEAIDDLQQAIDLKPQHISHYQLTLEEGTPFYHQPPALPDNDAAWEMQSTSQALLKDNGYSQYEVSAYAQEGYRCRHNLNYWQFGDYLAVGAGAHAKITQIDGRIIREARIKAPNAYIQATKKETFVDSSQTLEVNDIGFEFMLNALRLNDGFSINDFEQRTGLPITIIKAILDSCEQEGLLHCNESRIRPTDFGKQHLNALVLRFLV